MAHSIQTDASGEYDCLNNRITTAHAGWDISTRPELQSIKQVGALIWSK